VLHHPEIVIIAGAKQAIRENLIVSAATSYNPDGSTARSELVFPNFSSFNKTEGLREPFLENCSQRLLLVVGKDPGSIYLLTRSLEYPVFV